MDLEILQYNHAEHFPHFWGIYSAFWKEVNSQDMEKLSNVTMNDGKVLVSSKLECKIDSAMRAGKKIKIILDRGSIIGFIQYKLLDEGVLFGDALYVLPEIRFNGIAKLVMDSFPNVKKILFQIHRDCPPSVMLGGFFTCKKLANSEELDLELWEAEYLPEIQGKNESVIQMKKEGRV